MQGRCLAHAAARSTLSACVHAVYIVVQLVLLQAGEIRVAHDVCCFDTGHSNVGSTDSFKPQGRPKKSDAGAVSCQTTARVTGVFPGRGSLSRPYSTIFRYSVPRLISSTEAACF